MLLDELEKAVQEIVRIFDDPEESKQWNDDTPRSIVFGGSLGAMTPQNRIAFVERYGEDMVAAMELDAKSLIREREERFKTSHYQQHAKEADAHTGLPKEGDFVWCSNSGMKRDDGSVREELDDYIRYHEYRRRLCKVSKVIEVYGNEYFKPGFLTRMVQMNDLQDMCGSCSEDLPEDANLYNLTEEQLRTFYTKGVVIINVDSGQWCLIDTEGYDYCRYLYMPDNWREMYKGVVEEIEIAIKAEEEAAKRKAQEAYEARKKEYKERCDKWMPLMVDVNVLMEEQARLWDAHRKAGYGKNTPEFKAYKEAVRKVHAARKANILAMCKAAFPDVKFSLTTNHGYGANYYLSWKGGPTEEEFNQKTDLILFEYGRDVFNGWDDSTTFEKQEFIEFSEYTMGKGSYTGRVKVLLDDEE